MPSSTCLRSTSLEMSANDRTLPRRIRRMLTSLGQGVSSGKKEYAMDKIEPLFTATATATGGRNGHTEAQDGSVRADLSVPKAMGGPEAWHDHARAPLRGGVCGLLRWRARFRRQAAQEGREPGARHCRRHDRTARGGRLRPRREAPRRGPKPPAGRADNSSTRPTRRSVPIRTPRAATWMSKSRSRALECVRDQGLSC